MANEKDIWGCFTICLQQVEVEMIEAMGYLDKKDYYVNFGPYTVRITFVCDNYLAQDKISIKFNDKPCCAINKADFCDAMIFDFEGQYINRKTSGETNAFHKKEAANLL